MGVPIGGAPMEHDYLLLQCIISVVRERGELDPGRKCDRESVDSSDLARDGRLPVSRGGRFQMKGARRRHSGWAQMDLWRNSPKLEVKPWM